MTIAASFRFTVSTTKTYMHLLYLFVIEIFTSSSEWVSTKRKRTMVVIYNPVKGNIFHYFAPICMQELELNDQNLPWYSESFGRLFEIRVTNPTILRLVCVPLKHDDNCVEFASQKTFPKTPADIVYTWYRISYRCLKDGTNATSPILNVYNTNQSPILWVECYLCLLQLENKSII